MDYVLYRNSKMKMNVTKNGKKKKLTYILLVITRKINNEKRKQLLNKHINSNNENKFKTKTVFSKKIQKKKKSCKTKKEKKMKN